jgi:hypothetical protein
MSQTGGFTRGDVRRSNPTPPVSKRLRIFIAIASGLICCLLLAGAWYIFLYLPMKREEERILRSRPPLEEFRIRPDRRNSLAQPSAAPTVLNPGAGSPLPATNP